MPCGDLPIKGNIVLVTGGGSGINLSFVKQAQRAEARGIVIGDLTLIEDAQRIVDASDNVVFSKCDVTKRADLEKLIKVSMDSFGDVPDIYVAGAGVFEPSWSNWWADTEDDRYAELDINVTGALKFSRIAMRSLLAKNKKGAILITASLAGYTGVLSAPLYCASKHAVVGFVRSMAELDGLDSIKVVAVAPGLVATPLWTDRPDIMKQFGYDEQHAVTPDFVAEKMMDLVTNGKYGGGSCLEVSAAAVRELGTWDIPAPKHPGTRITPEAIDANLAPLRAFIEKDRKLQI